MKRKGSGSFALLNPETVDGVEHEPGTAVPVGALGVDEAMVDVGALAVVVGGVLTGGGGEAAPGKH